MGIAITITITDHTNEHLRVARRRAMTVAFIFDFFDCSEKMLKYDILETFLDIRNRTFNF